MAEILADLYDIIMEKEKSLGINHTLFMDCQDQILMIKNCVHRNNYIQINNRKTFLSLIINQFVNGYLDLFFKI